MSSNDSIDMEITTILMQTCLGRILESLWFWNAWNHLKHQIAKKMRMRSYVTWSACLKKRKKWMSVQCQKLHLFEVNHSDTISLYQTLPSLCHPYHYRKGMSLSMLLATQLKGSPQYMDIANVLGPWRTSPARWSQPTKYFCLWKPNSNQREYLVGWLSQVRTCQTYCVAVTSFFKHISLILLQMMHWNRHCLILCLMTRLSINCFQRWWLVKQVEF